MNKESLENFERRVFQITIGDLANISDPKVVDEIIEFKDIKITFNLFKQIFFDNNYNHFEMNNQYRLFEAIQINNKVIESSSFYKNYIGTKVNIMDILILNYMKNKKTRLDDISKISLIKDFSMYDSLVDFKVYNNHLSLDNVFTLFNMYKNKNSKKYFRFKVKATYYSSIIDETISMYFNYIVKIPKYYKKDMKEQVVDNEFMFEESEESEVNAVSDVNSVSVSEVKKVENIVYSNYNNKKRDENINIEVKELVLYDSAEVVSDDEDDDASESNMTESSFGNNESDDPFF